MDLIQQKSLFLFTLFFSAPLLSIAQPNISKLISKPISNPPSVALPANFLPVPLLRQQTNYSCGTVATLALLRYWKPNQFNSVSEQALYKPLNTTPANGTDPGPMTRYLNKQPGLQAEYKTASNGVNIHKIKQAIRQEQPVIVDLQAYRASPPQSWTTRWDDGHYIVLVGFEDPYLFFMDPSKLGRYGYITEKEFQARWHDIVGPKNVRTYNMAIFVHFNPKTADQAAYIP